MGNSNWKKIYTGIETPLNDLSAEDINTLKKLGVRYLKIRVDLPEDQPPTALPRLANKYNAFYPYPEDILDRCTILGFDKEGPGPEYIVFDLEYKSTTISIDSEK